MKRIDFDTIPSTNTCAKQLRADGDLLVTAQFQTAGRGSGRNVWESARGENLLFSLSVCPRGVVARDSFVLSEALALAVSSTLLSYADGFQVKWPNDIYHEDRKVAGLLIENELAGERVVRSVMGVGLNVNQMQFVSDAPNPVSLRQIVGKPIDREAVLQEFLKNMNDLLGQIGEGRYAEIHSCYLARLFRMGEGHLYADAAGRFRATITGVEPSGHLLLIDDEGQRRRYAFKEITYII